MKVAIYCRKSSKPEDRQMPSIPKQRRICDEIIRGQKDLEVVKIFEEKASAKEVGRPKFGEMMKMVERGEIDGIVCWMLHRLARNSMDSGHIEHRLLGDRILKKIFTSEKVYDKTTTVVELSVGFAIAAQFSIDLAKNIKDGTMHLFSTGGFPLSSVPIGYRRVKFSVIEPAENAPLVKLLFEKYAYEDFNYFQLNKFMRKQGLTSRTGRALGKSGIERILTNPIYYGVTRWRTPEGEQFFNGNHEPIISKSLWEKCENKRLNKNRAGVKRHCYLFTKKIKCDCGWNLTAYQTKNIVYLECKNPDCNRDFKIAGKSRKTLPEKFLLKNLLQIFDKIKIPNEVNDEIRKQLLLLSKTQMADQNAERNVLKSQLSKIEQKEVNLREDRINRVFSESEFIEEKNKLVQQKQFLLEKISNTNLEDSLDRTIEKFLRISDLIRNHFIEGDLDTQRFNFELLFESVQMQSGKAKIEFTELGKWLFSLRFYDPKIQNFELPNPSLSKGSAYFFLKIEPWWSLRDLNPRPLACHASALAS